MEKIICFLAVGLILASCDKDDDGPNQHAPVSNNLPDSYQAWQGIFDGNGVGAAADLQSGVILLFNQDGDRYAWFEEGEIKVELGLNDNESIFRNAQLQSVGAATRTEEGRLFIFNKEGEQYTYADFDPDEAEGGWTNQDLFTWSTAFSESQEWAAGGSMAFNRISAMWTLTNDGGECNQAFVDFETIYMANGNGDQLQPYFIPESFFSDGPFDLSLWTASNLCGGPDGVMPFDQIGAACRNIGDNQIEEILFSADGTQFCYYTVSAGEVSEIFNLY